jgi:MFS family permease
MSLSTTLVWWGISSWISPFVAAAAGNAHFPPQQWVSSAGMAYNFGGILGYIAFGFLADRFGRKPIVMLYFAGAFLMTLVLYLWTQDINLLLLAALVNGVFTLGIYSWMPVW